MGQEIAAVIRKKDTPRDKDGCKQEIATINFVCGRGDLQDILISNLEWDDNQEYVINENNVQKFKNACSLLAAERDRTENELKVLIEQIKQKTMLGCISANKEIAKESLEDVDYYCGEGLEMFWDAFYLINHLTDMCYTSLELYNSLVENNKDKTDLEICLIWSY